MSTKVNAATQLQGTVPVADLPIMVGDSGSGGTAGLVPAPPSGSAAAGKFLKADGTFAVPPGSTSGTVTSVALTMPSEFSVSGSPITSSGTLAVTKANESANTGFFGPTSGGAAAPTFRAMVNADLPSASQIGNIPYDVISGLPGKPGASAIVCLMTFTRTVVFAGNFSGSAGTVGTNPTATATYTVKKNGSSVGTVVVSTGGVVTFTTTAGATETFNSGDRLEVDAPSSQDATLSDVAFTLSGTR